MIFLELKIERVTDDELNSFTDEDKKRLTYIT